ncbi:uncharacterized protein LOC130744049 [Lotus japonicus]|nr:uncharacterized protein LOC130744049 [Lotus japonicus]
MEEWKDLDFSLEESEALILGENNTSPNAFENTVVGKVWAQDSFNVKAFKSTLLTIWKTREAVEIIELEKNLFSFKFAAARDRDLVLRGQPWTFNGHVVALQKITGEEQPSEINPHTCPMWVRIYDLPLNLRDAENLNKIGGSLGEFMEHDKSEECLAGKYARVRVSVDLQKPLKRGAIAQITPIKKGKIFFKYERLPDFCYECGMLGHTFKDCPDRDDDREEDEKQKFPFGKWMRASPRKVTLVRKEGYAESGKSMRKSLFKS